MRWMTTVALAALLGGCGFELGPQADFEPPMSGDQAQTTLSQGRIDGRLGRFDVATDDVYGYAGGWDRSTFVDVRGQGANGVLMAFLQIEGIDLGELEEGDVIDTMDFESKWGPEDAFAMVMVCAGEKDDEWEEDVPLEEGEIEVKEKDTEEGTITMEVRGQVPYGDSLEARFTVDLNEMSLVE